MMKRTADIASYVLKGTEQYRVSRFHTLTGEFVGLEALVRDFPRAALGSLLRTTLQHYPAKPWAPLPLIRKMEQIAKHPQRVLEVGAGMSTIWWAEQGSTVHAIEGDRSWYEVLKTEIRKRKLTSRVTLELREDAGYADLSAFPPGAFTFVTIDGHSRHEVVPQVPRLLSPPAWLLLGDTDKAAIWHEHWGESLDALKDLVRDHPRATLTSYGGFGPTSIAPGQDTLAYFPVIEQLR